MTIDQEAWIEGACNLSPLDEFEIGIRSDLSLAIKYLRGVLAIVDDQQSGLKGEAQRDIDDRRPIAGLHAIETASPSRSHLKATDIGIVAGALIDGKGAMPLA
jgi:hypothetical protein